MISEFAQISEKAQLGINVQVGPFTVIHEDVVIGDNVRIHSNVAIYPGTRIGNNCEVYPGAVIGAVPQDLKFEGEETTVEIGDNTIIRECVTIHRATKDKWVTRIGSRCLIMAYVHVAHDCQIGNGVILASYVGLSGHCIVDDFAILEGNVGTQQFMRIGKYAFVAGATLVRKDVPPYVKAAREPITFAGVNSIGLRRRGFSDEAVREIEDVYRTIFVLNTNVSKGIQAVKEQMPDSAYAKEIIEFVESSDKGIIRGMI
ncbi:acyl-ACP--UDP-N-acetylglucosamine O-acyltransferase [Crocinitomicaceae bacterium CZZ-1]|uniref:Acyl-ACP--UDP-N-acetylglucosamine O-acyltransferase n=1 Tax=Taishania pollutisoli TaxID=2766479 RepID=A0A8J6P9N4_9FLAO|nr:acyl-ACP--UDP-N-acetylglucosamine O-acyltransferase [Taishania pollutisoli]MBC9811173.1 acyl-ACP--UDP-N-acetylglucosamine O-acyltransferase [Taishania pollutisoli]MBX2947911.1 acyl-ACP--UDP-N-acetylglucosamine O-acyltransferase [Crocinitomicaceae bacterium]NGF76727.1 acyl-ACP--UDP-N-acetylglucosamine O-acyltransferase [Fluviicola sp. SGL-29]